ncbi:MAG: glycosyltransferase family 39 protein [Caldilineales bacterium]
MKREGAVSGVFHVSRFTFRRSWLPVVVLALLILFHLVSNIIWLQQDGRSFYGDTGNHARATMAILDALRTPGLDMLARINRATTFWPPLAYFMAQPLYVLFGVSTDVTALTTTIWFALAILFTYFLGRRLYGWRTGLWAAVLFSFYPAVYLQSRTYYVDIALTAMVLIALYCLLRTDAFRKRRASILFGVVLGLAALTKNAFIIMTIGPILGVAAIALWSGGHTAWQQIFAWRPGKPLEPAGAGLAQRLVNIVLAAVIAVLLAAPWYISHLVTLALNAVQVTSAPHLATKPVTWYAAKFDEGLLIWAYVLLLIGLVVGLVRFRRHWFTVVWLLSSVAILTMITRQNVRYLLPVMPAAALLSVDWIVLLPSRAVRAALLSVTVLFQGAMFFVMSWGAPAGWNAALHVPIQDAHNPFNDNTSNRPQAIDPLAFLYYQYPPKAHRWPVRAILDTVISDIEQSGQSDQPHRFVSLSKVLDFEYSTFAYETELSRSQGRPGAQNLQVADVQARTDYLLDFLDFDYVLFKSNDKTNMARRQNHVATRELWASGEEMFRQRFTTLATWQLSDGSYAELAVRNGPPLAMLDPETLRPILRRDRVDAAGPAGAPDAGAAWAGAATTARPHRAG